MPIASVGSGAVKKVVSFLAVWRWRSVVIGAVSELRLRLSGLSGK